MRRLPRIIAIASSCCLLWFATGCGTENAPTNTPNSNAKKDDVSSTKTGVDQPASNDSNVTPPPAVIPVAPGPIVGPTPIGGGGGSQGGERPARTGNPDNDPTIPFESSCDDLIDNDEDGLTDCADPDCANKACSDQNGCTTDDVCTNQECAGTPRNCENEIGNECSVDTCEPVANSNVEYRCVSVFDSSKEDFDSCTPSDNCERRNADGTCAEEVDLCIVGKCVVVEGDSSVTFECQAANLVDLTTAEALGGCADGNSCTADRCEEGRCEYSELDHVPCDDLNGCTVFDTCFLGECIGENAPDICTDDSQCTRGFGCRSIPGTCQLNGPGVSVVGFPCFGEADCGPDEFCDGEVLLGCACDDNNSCTEPDTCGGGECIGDDSPEGDVGCDDGNDCTDDRCVEGDCINTVDNTNECNDGIECTTNNICVNGECNGTPTNELCDEPGLCVDCGCDVNEGCVCALLTGPSDEQCSILLTNLGLSAPLNLALNLLNVNLNCEVGLTACVEGEVGSCLLSDTFAGICTGAALDAACGTSVFSLEINAAVTALLCLELNAF